MALITEDPVQKDAHLNPVRFWILREVVNRRPRDRNVLIEPLIQSAASVVIPATRHDRPRFVDLPPGVFEGVLPFGNDGTAELIAAFVRLPKKSVNAEFHKRVGGDPLAHGGRDRSHTARLKIGSETQ